MLQAIQSYFSILHPKNFRRCGKYSRKLSACFHTDKSNSLSQVDDYSSRYKPSKATSPFSTPRIFYAVKNTVESWVLWHWLIQLTVSSRWLFIMLQAIHSYFSIFLPKNFRRCGKYSRKLSAFTLTNPTHCLK
jgi:hypothetical protein